MGTVVPQIMWSLSSIEDRVQFGGEAELQMPVFFEGVDGKLGLSLEAATSGRCDSLVNAKQTAPLGQKSVTNIRITVGCRSSSHFGHKSLTEILFFCSGWVTKSSNVRFKFATKRGSIIPSLLRDSLINLGEL